MKLNNSVPDQYFPNLGFGQKTKQQQLSRNMSEAGFIEKSISRT